MATANYAITVVINNTADFDSRELLSQFEAAILSLSSTVHSVFSTLSGTDVASRFIRRLNCIYGLEQSKKGLLHTHILLSVSQKCPVQVKSQKVKAFFEGRIKLAVKLHTQCFYLKTKEDKDRWADYCTKEGNTLHHLYSSKEESQQAQQPQEEKVPHPIEEAQDKKEQLVSQQDEPTQ